MGMFNLLNFKKKTYKNKLGIGMFIDSVDL
jgi:hypothetical protein